MGEPGVIRFDAPTVGRDRESAALDAALRDSRPVVVLGPAGVGKTRLLRDALDRANADGRTVRFAIATRAAAASPYAALAGVLVDVPAVDHEQRAAWYQAVAKALRPADGEHTVVIGVDDAHLLDAGSAALLLHLAVTRAATVVLTVRSGEPVPDPVTALWKDDIARRIDLAPLAADVVAAAIADMLPGPVSERAERRLAAVSAGNILFARELVRGAVESGALAPVEGIWRWNGDVVLAPRLVDAVSERLTGLSGDELAALGTVALGDPLRASIAETLCRTADFAALERRSLIMVTDDGSVRPSHPLYGEVALQRLGGMAERELLSHLIHALAKSSDLGDADIVRIASGALRLGDDVPADRLEQAARIANDSFDFDLGLRLATAALDRDGRPGAALAAAVAAAGRNDFARAERVLAGAEAGILTEHHDLCERYLVNRVRVLQQGLGRVDDALAVIERFAAAHRDGTGGHQRHARQWARAHRAQVYVEQGRLAEVVAVTGPLVDDHAAPLARLLAAETRGEALAYQGMTTQSRQAVADLVALGNDDAFMVRRAATTAIGQDIMCSMLDGHVARAAAVAAGLLDRARLEPDPIMRGMCALVAGTASLRCGRPATARSLLVDADTAFRTSDISGHRGWIAALRAQCDALLGDDPDARQRWERTRTDQPSQRAARTECDSVMADAFLRMASGDTTGATAIALVGADSMGECLVYEAQLLHVAVRWGAPDRRVARRLRSLAGRVESPLPALYAAHAEALVDGDGRALADVSRWFARNGAILKAAEAASQAARAYRQAGRQGSAATMRARARTLSGRCEGARTPALDVSGPVARLSRREREVARLAGQGLANTEVAQRLGLSSRTVESHLYRAFAKLGVTKRSELPGLLEMARDS